jgi:hypothetical protein
MAIITIVVLYSLRALAGGISCINDFTWLQCISSLIPAIIAWCYWPGVKENDASSPAFITFNGEKVE